MRTPTQQLRASAELAASCESLLRDALQQVLRATGAHSASLVVHRRQVQALEFALTTGEQGTRTPDQARIPEGRGVVGDVIRGGRSALVNEPAADPRFFDVVDRASGFATRNLLVVPLVHDGRVAAAVCAINKPGGFAEADRDRCLDLVGALEQQLRQRADAERFFAG